MTRYYYDCPIDAAFMAKRHGMTFTDKDGGRIDLYMNGSGCASIYRDSIFYLTPESEAMFARGEKDLVFYCDGSMGPTGTEYTNREGDFTNYLKNWQWIDYVRLKGSIFIMPKGEEV